MLNDYLRVLLRRWWLVALPVVVLAAVTAATYRAPVAGYTVTLRYAAGLPPEQTATAFNYDRYYSWLSSEYMANGFADVARTSIFAQNVASRVNAQGIIVSPAQLEGAISSDQKQSIMVVYLNWPDAAQAVQIGNAISAEFTEHGAVYWPQIASAKGAPLVQLDKPVAVPAAISLRDRFDLPMRFIVALAAGLALALFAHFFDPYVRERHDLERLGMNIIVSIPVRRQGGSHR